MEITKQIDETTQEVYGFKSFGFILVFVHYTLQEKPKGKRKWVTKKLWDKYGKKSDNTIEDVALPEDVRHLVYIEVCKSIKIKTWEEWKE